MGFVASTASKLWYSSGYRAFIARKGRSSPCREKQRGDRRLSQFSPRRVVRHSLDVELRSAPVPSLGVVADGVARAQPDPLWDRSVLLGSLCELLLRPEGLHHKTCQSSRSRHLKSTGTVAELGLVDSDKRLARRQRQVCCRELCRCIAEVEPTLAPSPHWSHKFASASPVLGDASTYLDRSHVCCVYRGSDSCCNHLYALVLTGHPIGCSAAAMHSLARSAE